MSMTLNASGRAINIGSESWNALRIGFRIAVDSTSPIVSARLGVYMSTSDHSMISADGPDAVGSGTFGNPIAYGYDLGLESSFWNPVVVDGVTCYAVAVAAQKFVGVPQYCSWAPSIGGCHISTDISLPSMFLATFTKTSPTIFTVIYQTAPQASDRDRNMLWEILQLESPGTFTLGASYDHAYGGEELPWFHLAWYGEYDMLIDDFMIYRYS